MAILSIYYGHLATKEYMATDALALHGYRKV